MLACAVRARAEVICRQVFSRRLLAVLWSRLSLALVVLHCDNLQSRDVFCCHDGERRCLLAPWCSLAAVRPSLNMKHMPGLCQKAERMDRRE